MDFTKKDPKTFVAEDSKAEYEIERSTISKHDHTIFVCSSFSEIPTLSLGYKICNNFSSFLNDSNFFLNYRLHPECFFVNVFDLDGNHLDTVIDSNFEKFCRTLCKYIFNTKEGAYRFKFFKYKALYKEKEGYIPLEKLEELESTTMMITIMQSQAYKSYHKKLTNHNHT